MHVPVNNCLSMQLVFSIIRCLPNLYIRLDIYESLVPLLNRRYVQTAILELAIMIKSFFISDINQCLQTYTVVSKQLHAVMLSIKKITKKAMPVEHRHSRASCFMKVTLIFRICNRLQVL